MDDDEILEIFRELGDRREPFIPSKTYIPVVDFTVDGDEYINIVSSLLGHDRNFLAYLTTKVFDYLGGGHLTIVDNTISPQQLVVSALCDESLKERRLFPGDEVITTASNVKTIAALIAKGITPVILDVNLDTMLPDLVELEVAIEEGKTKAIILPCPNGGLNESEKIQDIIDEFSILFVEDVGYGFGGSSYSVPVGAYSDMAIYSFYSKFFGNCSIIVSKSTAHHNVIQRLVGRLGCSVDKSSIMCGYLSAQMDKVDYLTSMRQLNFSRLQKGLEKYANWMKFQICDNAVKPSWTEFPIILKMPYEHKFGRDEFITFLEDRSIGCRKLCGNFEKLEIVKPTDYRVFNELVTSNYIHDNAFAVGCGSNMTEQHTNYIIQCIDEFMERTK